jgi:hypothetical protein
LVPYLGSKVRISPDFPAGTTRRWTKAALIIGRLTKPRIFLFDVGGSSELKPWLHDILLAFFFAVLIVIFVVSRSGQKAQHATSWSIERIFVNGSSTGSQDPPSDIVIFWHPRTNSRSSKSDLFGR